MNRRLLLSALLCASASTLFGATRPLRILLTNDDGYSFVGIQTIRGILTAAGHTVTIVAPRTDQSGKGTSFASSGKLNVKLESPGVYSVDGTPSDSVRVGLDIIFRGNRPDLVVSGVNFGENLGTIANSSGTVSAAIWAVNAGVPAIAVSAGLNFAEAAQNFPSTVRAMQAASDRVVSLIDVLESTRPAGQGLLPPGVGLNINHPALSNPGSPLMTTLSRSYNTLRIGLTQDADYATTGNVSVTVLPAPAPSRPDRLTDAEMFAAGYITITPLSGDWTALSQLPELRRRLPEFIE